MTEQQEFIEFFKSKPEVEQTAKSMIELINKENKNMKNTKANTTAEIKATTKTTKATAPKETVSNGLKIEKGIPMPPAGRSASAFTQAAKEMCVGDSLKISTLPKSLYQTGKKLGVKFSNRKEADGSYRIWRIS